MAQAVLTKQIEALVDSVRKREQEPLSLADISAVTEVLIKTMQMYFRSVDLRIYQECQSLSDYISNARKEIAALQPTGPGGARIPRAGKELDAIVKQTEEATNTIMEAAEEIMAADTSDFDQYTATVQSAVMRIFEACSFQDITGQRISKVVDTLQYIEKRANDLRQIMGVDEHLEAIHAEPEPVDEDKALLSGPALDGEGIDQAGVDALLAGAVDAQHKVAEKPKPATRKTTSRSKAVAVDEPVAAAPVKEKRTTQADIDALFN